MKKIKLLSMFVVMAIVAVMFAGCSEIKDFSKTKYASGAYQTITLTDGDTVVYTENRSYRDGVIDIKIKKLANDAYAESFTETEERKSYDKIPYFDVYRKKNYKGGVCKIEGDTLTFKVEQKRLEDLLGLDRNDVSGDVTVTAVATDKTPKTLTVEYVTKSGKQAKIVTEYIFDESEAE